MIEAKAIAAAVAMLSHDGGRPGGGEATGWEGRRHEGEGGGARFVEWNLQTDVGMTCGGVVRLFFERYNVAAWPVVIFGAGHCAQALVRLLLTLRCQVTVIDPRPEWLAKLPAAGADAAAGSGRLHAIHADRPMASYVPDLPRRAFVLLMTMGHSSDQPILIDILKTRGGMAGQPAAGDRGGPHGFPYVGVIGSAAKAGALKRGLLAAGIPEADATPGHRYLCPIGLPLGTNDPAEIAVSVAAQLLAWRDGRQGGMPAAGLLTPAAPPAAAPSDIPS
jgi:xanthine dehydrogenase accessory factor